jgi:hypothetical protein
MTPARRVLGCVVNGVDYLRNTVARLRRRAPRGRAARPKSLFLPRPEPSFGATKTLSAGAA